jgi:indole-3-glycerol phosphate synthase
VSGETGGRAPLGEPGALEPILARTRALVAARRAARPGLRALPDPARRERFMGALRAPGVALIAEHKRRSPSAGRIREDLELEHVVRAYVAGGAAALSILTEEGSFGGSLEDLRRARAITTLPILRKDFVIDPHQLHEALEAGADAVLLIVAALADGELAELHAQAQRLGLAALVEVHDEAELERALALAPELVGINNRDLRTLEVDTTRALALRGRIPPGVSVVAESGYGDPEQLEELEAAGVDGVLIGERLMRAADVEAACRALARSRSRSRLRLD